MGGGSYTPSSRRMSSGYRSSTSLSTDHLPDTQVSGLVRGGDPKNRPKKRGKITTDAESPVVVAFDNTGSMGDWVDEFYKRAPMFYGQIVLHNYLADPAISFAVVADSTCDDEGLQVTEFCKGDSLDEALETLYIERGGGGQYKESYQLAAYYYTKKVGLPKGLKAKPFFFFFGDEGFYDSVTKKDVSGIFGDKGNAVDTDKLFKKLTDTYDVYILRKPYNSSGAEEIIQAMWERVLGSQRVIMLKKGRQVVDTMLGIIAMRKGITLEEYLDQLKERKQTKSRMADVKWSLKGLAQTIEVVKEEPVPPMI